MQKKRPSKVYFLAALLIAMALLLLTKGLSAVDAQAQESRSRKSHLSDPALRAFAPTDHISADQAVAFPTDI